MARARITGTKSGRAIGLPAITDATRDAICGLLGAGQSERAIVAAAGGISKGSIGRVRAAMAATVPPEGCPGLPGLKAAGPPLQGGAATALA
jgi:hypothetical protein